MTEAEICTKERCLQKACGAIKLGNATCKKVAMMLEPSTGTLANAKKRAVRAFARLRALPRDPKEGEMADPVAAQLLESRARANGQMIHCAGRIRGDAFYQVHRAGA